MKGYRTILFHVACALLGLPGVQMADLSSTERAVATLFIAVVSFGGIALRLITTTPIGQKAEAKIENALGITHDEMEALIAKLPQQADVGALVAQIQTIAADVAAVKASAPAPAIKFDPPPTAAALMGAAAPDPNTLILSTNQPA